MEVFPASWFLLEPLTLLLILGGAVQMGKDVPGAERTTVHLVCVCVCVCVLEVESVDRSEVRSGQVPSQIVI